MATYTKYQDFVLQLCKAVHNFSTHSFKVALSNGTPSVGHTILTDITELTTAAGYTQGGQSTTVGVTQSTGTATVTSTDPTAWTASGSGITFRYAALYNDTATSPNDALVAYWDNGTSSTITSGNTLQVDFGATTFTLT